MPASMTAFALAEGDGEWGQLAWELRSLNHRHLDVSVHLPDDLRFLESAVRECVGQQINRGKVECSLRYEGMQRAYKLCVNQELARQLIQLADELPLDAGAALNPVDVLRWPGVIEKTRPDLHCITAPALALLEEALAQLLTEKRREGAVLGEIIAGKCELCLRCIRQLRDDLPTILAAIRTRYLDGVQTLKITMDNDRLEQELALLLQKQDVAEELDRAQTHICEARRLLDEAIPVGRRLEFLMQEMNREANTLGAKSAHIDTSRASIELKTLIEQMREQARNIE